MTSTKAELLAMDKLLDKQETEGDSSITEADSTFIKSFLDTADSRGRDLVAEAFPCEYDEWCQEIGNGARWEGM